MAVKLLEQIRMAEQAAEQMRHDAQREAREMIKASEEASAHARRDADLNARTLYRKEMARNEQRVSEELRSAAHVQEAQRRQVVERARTRIPDAAKLIAERILSDGHR